MKRGHTVQNLALILWGHTMEQMEKAELKTGAE